MKANNDQESTACHQQHSTRRTRLHALMTAQRPTVQRFMTLSVLNVLAAGIFFLIQTHIANVIGRTQFGLLAYGMAFGIYGQAFVSYGQERSLVRDLVQHPDRFASMVIGSLYLRMTLFIAVTVGLVFWRLAGPRSVSWGIIAVILAYTLKSLDLQAVYDTWQRMGRHAAYALLQRVLYTALICLLLYAVQVKLTITLVGLALLVSQILYLIIQHRWVFRRLSLQARQTVSWREVLLQARHGSWLCLSLILSLSLLSLNQILIKHYAGSHELGGYAAAWQITMIIVLFIQFAARVGGPRLAAVTHENAGYREQLRFLVIYSFTTMVMVLPIVAIVLCFPSHIMGLFYSAEYHEEARVLYPMGLYALLLALGVVFEQFIVSTRMEVAYFLAMLLSGLICTIFGIIVIPRMGGYGAGWGLVLSYGAAIVVYLAAIIAHLHRVHRTGSDRPIVAVASER